jgi:hypothetical protein
LRPIGVAEKRTSEANLHVLPTSSARTLEQQAFAGCCTSCKLGPNGFTRVRDADPFTGSLPGTLSPRPVHTSFGRVPSYSQHEPDARYFHMVIAN